MRLLDQTPGEWSLNVSYAPSEIEWDLLHSHLDRVLVPPRALSSVTIQSGSVVLSSATLGNRDPRRVLADMALQGSAPLLYDAAIDLLQHLHALCGAVEDVLDCLPSRNPEGDYLRQSLLLEARGHAAREIIKDVRKRVMLLREVGS